MQGPGRPKFCIFQGLPEGPSLQEAPGEAVTDTEAVSDTGADA